MSARSSELELPGFLRRRFGISAPSRVAFDTTIRLLRWSPTFLLTHPDDVRHVLVGKRDNYGKNRRLASDEGRERAGHGVLTSTGEAHKLLRRQLQPVFNGAQLDKHREIVAHCIDRALDPWRSGAVLDVAAEMSRLTLSVLIATVFGPSSERYEARLREAVAARRRYTEYVYYSRVPFRTYLPLPVVFGNREAVRVIDESVRSEISRRRREGVAGDDFLGDLLDIQRPDGSRLSDDEIRDEILTLTSAGHETLGDALAWTWHLLSEHPEAQEALREEVTSADAGAPPESLDFGRSVLLESMRLYPPTWMYERVAIEADELPSGLSVPKGASLYLCQYVMNRHPRFFPDPERFLPERFASTSRRPHRFAYFPFGDGAHVCLGESFAMMQGLQILGTIARRFRLIATGARVAPEATITLTPRGGVWLQVQQR